MVRRSKDQEGKTYITGKNNKSIYSNVFKNDYKNIIDDYINKKIKEKDILDKLNKVNKEVENYEKNKDLYKNSPNIENQIINSKKYVEGFKKIIRLIDSNKIRIGKDLIQASTIAIPWIDDWQLHKQINEDVFAKYTKYKDSFELLSINTFLDNINSSITKNKKDARKEFNTVKKHVQSKSLKHIVKELEKSIFGNDEERTFAPSGTTEPKIDFSKATVDFLEYMKKEKEGKKRFSDDYDSNGWSSGSRNVVSKAKGASLKILTNKQMLKRLPILLAQIQAGNNSNKLKNEARQILYLLYRSKLLTKTVYNNLIKLILRH